MRNRQAQFIPAASEPMGLIKPIDPKYGYMAQPKKAESVLAKPIKGEVGLYQQTLDMQNMISDTELGYQQLYDNMNNFISSLPGGFQTFTTSNDPEIKKARDSFNVQRMVLNQQSDIIEAAKGTIQSNFTAWKEDNALAQHRTAITEQGVNVRYKILDKKTGNYVEKTTTANPFQLLNAGSGLNGDNKIIFEADDITNIGDYRKSQNENLNAFQDGKAANYNRVLKIDYDKERANILNSVKDVGNITVTRNSANSKRYGNTTAAVTISSEQGSNMFPLYQTILNYTNTESTEDANTKYYLFDEFVEYMKQNGSIPLMTLENFTKEQEEQIKKTGSFTDSDGRVNKFEFNVIPKIENGKQVTTDKINKESYLSFVTNYIVNKANPQIKIVDEMGEKTTAIANNTQSSQPLPKEKINEFDGKRINVNQQYSSKMSTTFNPITVGTAVNTTKSALKQFGISINEEYYTNYITASKNLQKFADENNIQGMSIEQTKAFHAEMGRLYDKTVESASIIMDAIVAETGYNNQKNPAVKTAIENVLNKAWMELFEPASKGVYKDGFFVQKALWSDFRKDAQIFDFKSSSANMRGDVYFANGQPIEDTDIANIGATILVLNRYSPNFINYDMTASFKDGVYKKMYQARNNQLFQFFNQSAVKGGGVTREAWETTVAVPNDVFETTLWYVTDSNGEKTRKLYSQMTNDEKKQLNVIPTTDMIYHRIPEDSRKNYTVMTAISYNLDNYAPTGGSVLPKDSDIK